MTPLVYLSKKDFPKYPGNLDTNPGTPAYHWILSAPGDPLNNISSTSISTWLTATPPLRASSSFSLSSTPADLCASCSAVAAKPYVAQPPTTPTHPVPEVAMEPAVNEHDEE